ncbi:hypothetical protein EH223_01615 [candidate division KSB1 bacterium]|nr:hypothetical protein [candidate division KSB1 bacterium]RQW06895.1 MAG: hypothetical protein EH223_01615 [candidate division KSB1 bacterium]
MKKVLAFSLFICLITVSTMCSKNSKNNTPTAPGPTGEVTVTKITYNGWENSYEMTNGLVKVVVVPAIGRIMYYGYVGGANVLWDDPSLYGKTLPSGQPYRVNGQITWANFGGDKVWPTEQSQFPAINGHSWPPDHWFDGGAHQADEIANGLRITSNVSDYCGAYSIREISLDPQSTQLLIQQTIKKVKRAQNSSVEPIDYTIWNITQIRSPHMAIFNLNPASSLPNKIHLWSNEAGAQISMDENIATFVPHPSRQLKAGADSDHWLGAIVENVVIGEFFRRQTGTYPDGGLSAEVYTSPQYTELELLSPFAQLNIGGSIRFDISWRLVKLPADAATMSQKRDAAVAWLNSFSN